ncbi:MAG: hypothetical protein WCP06_07310 [Verrucomicrobiota bacterium]
MLEPRDVSLLAPAKPQELVLLGDSSARIATPNFRRINREKGGSRWGQAAFDLGSGVQGETGALGWRFEAP